MTARTAKVEDESALVPTIKGDERQTVLMKAIGFDKLSDEERELGLNIAQKYNLDLLLGHLVLIDGRAYITRDGLLHVAHESGQFDGIEVSEPLQMDDGQWRCVAKVWRKDMSHPFVYSGRYAAANRRRGNANYEPEMAIKVAEVMSLRRAFDVSAPIAEERWNEAAAPEAGNPETPRSIDDALDAKLAAIPDDAVPETVRATQDEPKTVGAIDSAPAPIEVVAAVVDGPAKSMTRASDAELEPDYGTFKGAPKTPKMVTRDPDLRVVSPLMAEPAKTDEPMIEPMSYEDFKGAIRGINKEYLKLVAAEMYPDSHGFKELTPEQLRSLYDAVKEEPALLSQPMSPETSATLEAICEQHSPFEGSNRCILPMGHKELHRASDMERWS
jgi:hypothetical protein